MFEKILKKLKGSDDGLRPNIIMILLDQFRNDARSEHKIFEEINRRGTLFSNTITYAPYTLASLHATYTGMYGTYNGVDAYTKSDHYKAKDCISLTQYLKKIGYYTRGYTFSKILFPHAGFDKLSIIHEDDEPDILESHIKELEVCFSQHKPFFSFLHYGEIHHEIVKKVIKKYDDFDERYFGRIDENRKRYTKLIRGAGEYTSEIINKIDELDQNKNTLIMVFTDHGGGLGEKPGEKAYGIYTYDYTIRTWVYFILPEVFPKNKEISKQIRTIDILPTLLDILNIKPSGKNKKHMGKSLMPYINGDESGHRDAFSETGGVQGPYPSPNKPNVKCLRDGKWKLIFNTTINQYELYHLTDDASETNNLYSVNQEQAEALLLKMAEFL